MNTRIAIKYGGLTGLIIMTSWFVSYFTWGGLHFAGSELFGYSVMLLAFSTIFLAIRGERKKSEKDEITFKKGFFTGLGISLVAAIIYVVGWIWIYMPAFEPDFVDRYEASQIEIVNQTESSSEIKMEQIQEIKEFNTSYRKPHVMAAFTFLEIFPIGLLVTIISALILRRKE
ncbi:MAG: DUF4199 domain-containing protein [Cyclobacteriaceae bacterium]